MIPIPEEVLIHSCVLKIYRVGGIYGGCGLEEEIPLTKVRISMMKKAENGTEGRVVKTSGTLYYDCTVSSPENTEFLLPGCRSVISFRDSELEITGVDYIYSDSGLHHLEISLGG